MISFLPKCKQPEDTPTVRLMKAMHFGGKDLDLNRAGELSETQKRRIHRVFFCHVFLCAMWAAGYVVMFLGVMVTIPLNRLVSNPMTYLMAGSICAGIWSLIYICNRHLKNVSTGHVVAFTGRIKKYPLLSKSSMVVISDIDRTERVYSGNGFWQERAFIEGETYTFYSPSFAQSRFVSAEHIPSL